MQRPSVDRHGALYGPRHRGRGTPDDREPHRRPLRRRRWSSPPPCGTPSDRHPTQRRSPQVGSLPLSSSPPGPSRGRISYGGSIQREAQICLSLEILAVLPEAASKGEQLLHLKGDNNFSESRCEPRDLANRSAMKNCYRQGGGEGPCRRMIRRSAKPITLTHRIPVSFTVTACFEAELHEHRLQLDHRTRTPKPATSALANLTRSSRSWRGSRRRFLLAAAPGRKPGAHREAGRRPAFPEAPRPRLPRR